ncbi:putative riboflavin synthase alpha chain [Micromonospora humidisoli]|uniref:Riboflavin synthase n=1 Tax=Micromonospora humidisoli TaxID=2807622 RepID=A0ABS2JJL5_9ACTN|nr:MULTISPECIES: riboflavin synthase [Micromonospora]MBM7086230.1 riboflavin synthase [Micromonospora humidisoli]GHJ08892.1 putative riboflavin synthase alpha chain [Micromonospora sp. AKA109]
MFTGIVEELGEVVRIADTGGDSALVAIRGPLVTSDARHGDSIAVNGVCLTVVDVDGGVFTADVMGETLRRSALGGLRPGDPVNLERAAALNSRLGGHLVQGHVDGVGEVLSREPAEQWETLRFRLPTALARYVVEKGSITVDGVSLTVAAVGDDWFAVGLIPTTLKLTTLGGRGVGAPVNLEVDVLAKYVERLLDARLPAGPAGTDGTAPALPGDAAGGAR